MATCAIVLVAMLALACNDTDLTTPEPDVSPLLIVGGDLGSQSQSLTVTRRRKPVLDAVVTVNGVTIPHLRGGRYERQLPAAVAPGSPLVLQVSSRGAMAQGTASVPEAPVLTAPATGTVFAPTDSFAVAWTSATNPDRFVVRASWVEDGGVRAESSPAPGSTRQLKLATSDFPADKEITFRVLAYNDGTWTGPVVADSRMNIRGEGASNAVITRTLTPLWIHAYMGARSQLVTVGDGAGQPVVHAVVMVNGRALTHVGGSFNQGDYRGELPEILPAGSPLELEVRVGSATVEGSVNVPETPIVTAPRGGTFVVADSIAVTWSSSTDPDAFMVAFGDVFPAFFQASGSARGLKVAASDIGAGDHLAVAVQALNFGSFDGPVRPDSPMNVSVWSPTGPVIAIRP